MTMWRDAIARRRNCAELQQNVARVLHMFGGGTIQPIHIIDRVRPQRGQRQK